MHGSNGNSEVFLPQYYFFLITNVHLVKDGVIHLVNISIIINLT